jgi:hypothetical protein
MNMLAALIFLFFYILVNCKIVLLIQRRFSLPSILVMMVMMMMLRSLNKGCGLSLSDLWRSEERIGDRFLGDDDFFSSIPKIDHFSLRSSDFSSKDVSLNRDAVLFNHWRLIMVMVMVAHLLQ